MSSIEDSIRYQAAESIATFRGRVLPVPWEPRSILLSEGFAFCAMCDLFGVTAVVESGVCNARSTVMWARYLQGKPLVGIDWKFTHEAYQKLQHFANVSLVQADATNTLLPEVRKLDEHSVGIFIDGPKGEAAVELAAECVRLDNVAFVGVHDMSWLLLGKPHAARAMLEAETGDKWFTDAQWFVDAYQDLDANESHWDNEQGTKWVPYFRCERDPEDKCTDLRIPRGSYGYTVGFLCRE
jgi:hypothetical protein